jgi:hypothetical protein
MRISEDSYMNEEHAQILEEEFGIISAEEEQTVAHALSDFIDGVGAFAEACYPDVSYGEGLVRTLNDMMNAEGQVPQKFRDASCDDFMLYVAGCSMGEAISEVANVLHAEEGGFLLEDESTQEYAAEAVLTLIALADKSALLSGGPTLSDKAKDYGITLHPAYRNV